MLEDCDRIPKRGVLMDIDSSDAMGHANDFSNRMGKEILTASKERGAIENFALLKKAHNKAENVEDIHKTEKSHLLKH